MLEEPSERNVLKGSNKAKVSLMWDILDYAAGRTNHQGKGLVQPSESRECRPDRKRGTFLSTFPTRHQQNAPSLDWA